MKIGFVAEPYETENASGMGYVVLEFMRNLAHQHTESDEMVVYSSREVSRKVIGQRVRNQLIPKNFFKKLLHFFFFADDVDTLLFMAPMLPLIVPRRIKVVMLCQELASQKIIPDSSEALFAFVRDRILMSISVRRASSIVVPSEATKHDLMVFYGTPEEKIVVIPDGYQDLKPYAPGEALEPGWKPFFFYTGRVKYRKNVHGIVNAFIVFKKRTKGTCKLIIGGGGGGPYHEEINKVIATEGMQKDIIFAGYVSIEKLYSLYVHALALVFPSFNEGFGMPIIEAMSLGTPVITSNISSMAEVAGDAGILVDPKNIDEISHAMERVYSDKKLRQTLTAKGYERARQFSWPQSGLQLLELLHSL